MSRRVRASTVRLSGSVVPRGIFFYQIQQARERPEIARDQKEKFLHRF
ncbi:hypothetical protein HanIR_Chr04g0197421 [Helianthus annuus]|nr:hypothetical protein HanIR_Chr04g0197421 [Helianthus annuus]